MSPTRPPDQPQSAVELARQLGDALPTVDDTPVEAVALADAARQLQAAVVATNAPSPLRAALATQLEDIAAQLRAHPRAQLIVLARHEDGRLENLTQAGSGRLNPHSIPLVFDPIPERSPGEPRSIEVRAHVTLDESHSGPPGKVHGGVLATLLDQVIGVAADVAGATGLTARLQLDYRAATPYGEPLTVTARYVATDGRKHTATGEIRVGGQVTVDAEALFVAPRGN